jgi:aryl-alcohol dehydrogenase-like predicted oxidoreductase
MRLTGKNLMGPPNDHEEAIRVLRHAVELGVRLIDTAWYYGPFVSNELIFEALYPYPDDLVLVTKLGGKRDANGGWGQAHTPTELCEGMEHDLRTLHLSSIPIVHLRWEGKALDEPFQEAVATFLALKQEGKLQHIGLSNVTQEQFDYALAQTPIATVSNTYNVLDRQDDAMVDRCEASGIAFLPFFPLAFGRIVRHDIFQKWARQLQVTPTQVALAALLHRSSTMLPIPGTSHVSHLEENWEAGNIELPQEAMAEIVSTP